MSRDVVDPVALSVLSAALAGIAEEMGALLVRGAYSANIKERRDCSAALFDAAGLMVAQAEHIPVHLGAMPEAVEAVRARDPAPGEIYVLNDPYTGGTHLPDLTLVSPVEAGGGRLAYAVTRAHHSDVGGMRPGSMPADSREIYQEGLVLPPLRLAEAQGFVAEALELVLANVRTPEVRRGDLLAQIAANRLAATRLAELARRVGEDVLRAAMGELLSYGERRSRDAIAAIADGAYRAEGEIEGDGTRDEDIPIRAEVTVAGEEMSIDFAGSAPQVAGNVNCPLAVTRSACYFALRVVLPRDIPVSAGVYAPLRIVAEPGLVVNARRPAAVVAGNVETSQRVADVVLAALARAVELPAQGQGTMNNVVLGGASWTYYETIGGGQGAGSAGPGPSGVHVGMSNTLNTPVEALELELPLRVERAELAYGSGGAGLHRGGDGIVRSVRALEPCWLSLLTDRRRHRPAGAAGGGPGAAGANALNGEALPPKASLALEAGDLLEIRTPGGGGWGAPAATADPGRGPA